VIALNYQPPETKELTQDRTAVMRDYSVGTLQIVLGYNKLLRSLVRQLTVQYACYLVAQLIN
jgi:hypothetical protein